MDKEKALQTLNLTPDAGINDVQNAFHKLAKTQHPDIVGYKENHEENFRVIVDAYNFLKSSFKNDNSIIESPLDDIIDVEMRIMISMEMSLTGGTVNIKPPKDSVCRECHGSGIIMNNDYICPDCNGSGRGMIIKNSLKLHTDCPSCKGTGRGKPETCPLCDGTGMDPQLKPIAILIRPGIEDGEQIRLEKQGKMNREGKVGDLIAIITINRNGNILRKGLDLKTKVYVSYTSLCLGGSAFVTIPGYKEKIKVSFAAGTPSGKVIKIEGKGVKSKNKTGNLFVSINARVPKKKPSRARMKCLKELYRLEREET